MSIDASFYDAVDLLKKLIAIPSFSREEATVADFLEEYLLKKNLHPQRKGNNIWLTSPNWDETKPIILLNSHIDTVRPVSGWTKDPFFPLEEDDKLYGLGSNDAGAPLVSLLQTFLFLTKIEQPNNFIFLASGEEEISGNGGVELILPELPPIALAVVGEPTNMQPAIAEKGLLVLDGVVHGKSGHAARNEGDNAIYKALSIIQWFQNLEFPLKSELLGAVKVTLTMIQAGTQHNVIPDRCQFTVDIRTNECYTNEQVLQYIQENCPCEINARSLRLNSSQIDIENPIVQRAILLGLDPFGSPTMSDQTKMSFPSIKIGPGNSARSHTADEFVYLSEIREALDIYIRLLDDLKYS